MKKHGKVLTILVPLVLVVALLVGVSTAKEVVNKYNVQNPTSLARLLNAIDTEIDALRTLTTELRTDHGTTRTVDGDQTTLLNNLRTWSQAFPLDNPGFAIDTNFDVKNANAFTYCIAGTLYSEAAEQSFNTGTTATVPAGKWCVGLLSLDASGTETVTFATNTANAGYDSEALAIAALPATPANHCPLGYVTVQAHASNAWIAGTSALTTGTGGNVAQATNYYNKIDAKSTITAAVSSSPPASITAPAATEQVQKGK